MEKAVCKYCNKVIESYSKEQVESLMAIHQISKHKDKVEIKEK